MKYFDLTKKSSSMQLFTHVINFDKEIACTWKAALGLQLDRFFSTTVQHKWGTKPATHVHVMQLPSCWTAAEQWLPSCWTAAGHTCTSQPSALCTPGQHQETNLDSTPSKPGQVQHTWGTKPAGQQLDARVHNLQHFSFHKCTWTTAAPDQHATRCHHYTFFVAGNSAWSGAWLCWKHEAVRL